METRGRVQGIAEVEGLAHGKVGEGRLYLDHPHIVL